MATLALREGFMFQPMYARAAAVLLLTATAAPVAAAAGSFGVVKIAVTGEEAPGLATPGTFQSFNAPVLNDFGGVAFHAAVTQPGAKRSVWVARGLALALELVAVVGEGAPGGGDFLDVSPPVLSDTGDIVFRGEPNLFNNAAGFWLGGGSQALTRIALTDEDAPGGGKFSISLDPEPVIDDLGRVAFSDTVLDRYFFYDGSLADVPAADPPFATVGAPGLNSAGDLAMKTSSGVSRPAIWTGTTAAVRRIADRQNNDPPPPIGSSWQQFGMGPGPGLNDAGWVAFRAIVVGPGGPGPSPQDGIFLNTGASQSLLVAREGDFAPGAETALFGGWTPTDIGDPLLNDRGEVAILATLVLGVGGVTEADNTGIWLGLPAGVVTPTPLDPPPAFSLVVREGDSAPDTGGGVFDDLRVTKSEYELRLCLNDMGDMAFFAKLQSGAGAPGGVTEADDGVIYVRERDGSFRLVVREGQSLPVAGAAEAVLTDLDLDFATPADPLARGSLNTSSGGSDGRGRCLSNSGAVAFRALFAGSVEGIYLSRPQNLVPSLRPTVLAVLAIAVLSSGVLQTWRSRKNSTPPSTPPGRGERSCLDL